jgi:hypothetical protein
LIFSVIFYTKRFALQYIVWQKQSSSLHVTLVVFASYKGRKSCLCYNCINSSDEYMRKGLGPAAGANLAGLKAGTATGVVTLVKNLKEGRSDDHEVRTWS